MSTVKMYLSCKGTDEKLAQKSDFKIGGQNPEVINIDDKKTYQTFIGFGGAFTEAAAYTLSRVPERREEVLKAYFDPEKGLGYTMGRVHIHSCDFALGNYTYVKDGDVSLESFDISRDYKWVIPMIKDAEKAAGQKISLLASPWSPPAWMKTNNEMNNGGKLLPQYAQTWADYMCRFLTEYKKAGLDMWALTVQNEPEAVQSWDSCIYTGEEERDFVKNHLGPALFANGHGDVKLCIWDHNRDIIVRRAEAVYSNPEAAKYVWGTAFHWYCSNEFENVGRVHELYPEKHLIFSEGCLEGGLKHGVWWAGEHYAVQIIGDLSNWTEAYLDWNLVLDETGGPNHVKNFCDAPVILDTRTKEAHYNLSYYYIGHFSKFIRPGAVRVGLDCGAEGIKAVAFKNTGGSIAAVILNRSDNGRSLNLNAAGQSVDFELPGHSIVTFVIS